ncbi:hypothetical protein ACFYYR_26615 [Streptomyces sp. NPDC001922]|uniref:hypothetical protein n=1 Tax=Streptomyces sp. NPDC001922 TaxID=3364624 RepID=UPI0036D130FC
MHAVLVTLTIEPVLAPVAAAALMEDIMPSVRSAPGFIAGYWMEPVDGRGLSMVLFESEDEARAATPPAADWTAPGVTIEGTEIRRVAATAP